MSEHAPKARKCILFEAYSHGDKSHKNDDDNAVSIREGPYLVHESQGRGPR